MAGLSMEAIVVESDERSYKSMLYNYSEHPMVVEDPTRFSAILSVGPVVLRGDANANIQVVAPNVYRQSSEGAALEEQRILLGTRVLLGVRDPRVSEANQQDLAKLKDVFVAHVESKTPLTSAEQAQVRQIMRRSDESLVEQMAERVLETDYTAPEA